jgi:hypothetical protein
VMIVIAMAPHDRISWRVVSAGQNDVRCNSRE